MPLLPPLRKSTIGAVKVIPPPDAPPEPEPTSATAGCPAVSEDGSGDVDLAGGAVRLGRRGDQADRTAGASGRGTGTGLTLRAFGVASSGTRVTGTACTSVASTCIAGRSRVEGGVVGD